MYTNLKMISSIFKGTCKTAQRQYGNMRQFYRTIYIPTKSINDGSGLNVNDLENMGYPKGSHEFPEENANYEISTEEWEFVERLMPPKHIPKPQFSPGEMAPSGWIAPSAKREDHPYFVMRNTHHLLRIYKDVNPITNEIRTKLKGIEGDVFTLGDELRKHLREVTAKKHVFLRVHEPHGVIIVQGDFPQIIREFLVGKGF